MNLVWAIRPTVASCSARIGAPFGGIITCWSQLRSASVLTRSAISARRRRSSSKRSWLTADRNLYETPGGDEAPRGTKGRAEGELRGRPLPPVFPHAAYGSGRGLYPPPAARGPPLAVSTSAGDSR